MYIRLKMNSNSVRIGFLSWQIFLFSLSGFRTHTSNIKWVMVFNDIIFQQYFSYIKYKGVNCI